MKNIFSFDSMLTPKIITIVYWCLLMWSLSCGLSIMFGYRGFDFDSFLGGIFTFVWLAVASRISCEVLIVLFKISDNLEEIKNKKNP